MNHRRAIVRGRDANHGLVSLIAAFFYLGLCSSCASTREQPRDVPLVPTPPLVTPTVAIETPLAEKAATAAPPNPTTTLASPLTPITWRATPLDTRPASHLVAGKHRVASIVRTSDNTHELMVYRLSSNDPASSAEAHTSVVLPAALQSATGNLELYMGRDDWPRIIVVAGQSTNTPKYFRYRPGKGWESPTDEQGALASPGRTAGYYGVLGHDDPELLCVPGVMCYEKRVSGWTKRPVPGPGHWKVVLTQAPMGDTSESEVWAWPRNSERPSLLQLGPDWTARVPAPSGPIQQMITWNQTYVALTDAGLSQLSPSQLSPSGVPPGAQAELHSQRRWHSLAPITDGTALIPGASSWLLVATKRGLLKWAVGDHEPTPVHLRLPGSPPLELGETCCIASTGGASASYFVASERGVFLLEGSDLQ